MANPSDSRFDKNLVGAQRRATGHSADQPSMRLQRPILSCPLEDLNKNAQLLRGVVDLASPGQESCSAELAQQSRVNPMVPNPRLAVKRIICSSAWGTALQIAG